MSGATDLSSRPSPEGRSRSGLRYAIGAMTFAMACFSAGDALMKYVTVDLPVGEMISIRSVFAVALILVVLHWRGGGVSREGLTSPVFWVRAALEGTVTGLFVTLLGKLTLGDLTTLSQITPILMTAFAAVLLKEQVGWRRWSATAVGFGGVLFVARPGAGGGLDPWALMAVLCAALVAARDLLTRRLPSRIRTGTVSLVSACAAAAAGLALGLNETWRTPTALEVGAAACAAALTTGGNLGLILAMRAGEVSAVAPFRYAVIPFSLFAGWAVFGERPDFYAIVGIALIVGSGLYTLHREQVRRADAPAATPPEGPRSP